MLDKEDVKKTFLSVFIVLNVAAHCQQRLYSN